MTIVPARYTDTVSGIEFEAKSQNGFERFKLCCDELLAVLMELDPELESAEGELLKGMAEAYARYEKRMGY